MSLHTCDLLVLGVLKKYSDRLIRKEYILDMLLDTYNTPEIKNLFTDSQKYIKEAKDIILNEKLKFRLPYQTQKVDDFSVIAITAGHESEKFLHDYGMSSLASKPSSVKRTINISSVDTNKNALNSTTCVQRGTILKNNVVPDWSSEVINLVDYGENTTKPTRFQLILESIPIKNNLPLAGGYYVQKSAIHTTQNVHKSIDDVNVTLLLNTAGSFYIHHIMNQYFRYLVKTSRQLLSFRGFQEISIQYSEIQSVGFSSGELPRFQTQFHLSGKAHDDWIFDESNNPNLISLTTSVVNDLEQEDQATQEDQTTQEDDDTEKEYTNGLDFKTNVSGTQGLFVTEREKL